MSFGLGHGRTLDITGVGYTRDDLPSFDPLNVDAARLDPRQWFDAPGRRFELEIGSGKGTFLIQTAPEHPETNYLGIEYAGEFFRYAADRIRRRRLPNVRMLHDDANVFLRYRCPDAIAQVIHLYFSDPWPKKRHHKRRVVQDESLRQMHRVLDADGELRIVTDHADLWGWYEDHAARHTDLFERIHFERDTDELVGTNYERKFAEEGREFHAMTLVKHS